MAFSYRQSDARQRIRMPAEISYFPSETDSFSDTIEDLQSGSEPDLPISQIGPLTKAAFRNRQQQKGKILQFRIQLEGRHLNGFIRKQGRKPLERIGPRAAIP